jgi:ribonuclease Z
LLTSADAFESAILAASAIEQLKKANKSYNNDVDNNQRDKLKTTATLKGEQHSKQAKRRPEEVSGGIELHGPIGTQAFVNSLRHFMRRDRFEFAVREGEQGETETVQEPKRKKTKQTNSASDPFLDYTIQPLAFQHSLDDEVTVPIQSFIFLTPPLVGRFRPDRAAALGIPKGPLYAQLKNGHSVTFLKEGKEETVHSHQVLEDGHPGIAVVVVYCPTTHVLRQLQECKQLQSLQDVANAETVLDLLVHITPRRVVMDADYQAWVHSFSSLTTHIWLDTCETIDDKHIQEPTPFVAASLGGMMRSMIHAGIYPSPLSQELTPLDLDVPPNMIVGKRHVEYVIIPRSKCGIKNVTTETLEEKIGEARQMVKLSGALEVAAEEMLPLSPSDAPGAIFFAGTGSALPCKHRNVSGICLTLAQHQCMLLDCGEGTVGQLLRSTASESILNRIQAVWVSHPHADHHLGILRLLSERGTKEEPLILIAPPNLFDFLTEYEVVDPTIRGTYLKIDCHDLVPPSTPNPKTSQLLVSRLGITSIPAIPVSQCRHAFAVVLDCKGTLGRVAYSGDCRPSMKFADLGLHADVLIHEATFENGMEAEAMLKKHSTVGEALSVATKMQAKAVLLTHFSQRYPKMPLLEPQSDSASNELTTMPVVFCFDFMNLTPGTIMQAAKLTDALRLLYPAEVEKKSDDEVDAKEIMSIPGLFAKSELL